ncbi:MAG: tRNA-dihydrouridine synthase family protein [Treponema sp.]|nr:tRNA-dihydrouridine synthase family protein [Treponema sp.]
MKFICGPMATLSHAAFRIAVEKCGGADEYFTEMINAPSLVTGGPFEKFYTENIPCPPKIVWQLTGNKGESLAKAASILAGIGGAGIDVNMGCSAPQIYKTGAGIAWMLKELGETREMIRGVRKAMDSCRSGIRLSVKCRLGPDNFTQDSFFSFTDMLVQEGVELITLHPRTIKEKERFAPRFEYAQMLIKRYGGKIPVYINGCITDSSTMQRACQLVPDASGIMISRAAAQKPWIFDQLRGGHAKLDAEKLALDFIEDLKQHQPPEFLKTRMQRFFFYYCKNFSFSHYFQNQMINASSMEESIARVKEYFEKQPLDRMIEY